MNNCYQVIKEDGTYREFPKSHEGLRMRLNAHGKIAQMLCGGTIMLLKLYGLSTMSRSYGTKISLTAMPKLMLMRWQVLVTARMKTTVAAAIGSH